MNLQKESTVGPAYNVPRFNVENVDFDLVKCYKFIISVLIQPAFFFLLLSSDLRKEIIMEA